MQMDMFEGVTNRGIAKLKYYFSEWKLHWKDWIWYYFQFTNHVVPLFYKGSIHEGIYVMREEWDNLIILDACRYDLFEKYINSLGIKGELRKIVSRGSSTVEFLKENFLDKEFHNTIYVTANPYISVILRKNFYKEVSIWKDFWDEDLQTVPPNPITEKAIEIKELYPEKRLIVHYLQPHSPFIGKFVIDKFKRKSFQDVALKYGKDSAIKAYESNFELLIPHLRRLCKELNGITVITSDHGEAYGERILKFIPIYGHPVGIHMPALVECPWFVVKSNTESTKSSIEKRDLEKHRIRTRIKELSRRL